MYHDLWYPAWLIQSNTGLTWSDFLIPLIIVGWKLSDTSIRAGLQCAYLVGRSQFLTSKEADMLGLPGATILLDGGLVPLFHDFLFHTTIWPHRLFRVITILVVHSFWFCLFLKIQSVQAHCYSQPIRMKKVMYFCLCSYISLATSEFS